VKSKSLYFFCFEAEVHFFHKNLVVALVDIVVFVADCIHCIEIFAVPVYFLAEVQVSQVSLLECLDII
jgi:hypothetical protein